MHMRRKHLPLWDTRTLKGILCHHTHFGTHENLTGSLSSIPNILPLPLRDTLYLPFNNNYLSFQTIYIRIPKKVKLQKEWPLGKLKPFTACSKGSDGLNLLTRNFIKNISPVLVTPIIMIYKKSFLSFINRSKMTRAI